MQRDVISNLRELCDEWESGEVHMGALITALTHTHSIVLISALMFFAFLHVYVLVTSISLISCTLVSFIY